MPEPSKPVEIVPFWNRLREVMLYPAHGSAMATIVMLALARLAIFLPLVGWIIVLLSFVAMLRYAFECLQLTAEGYMQPPDVSANSNRGLAWKYLGAMLILGFLVGFGLYFLGPVLGGVLLLFVLVCFPASTMTLAMEESLGASLDPMKWIAIIANVGWPYLAVVGLCLVISLSEGYARVLLLHFMPQAVAILGIGLVSGYATVMTFHLMGYLLYQYHESLGLTPAAPQQERSSATADPDQDKLDAAAALVRDGKLQEATDLLRAQIRRGGTPGVHAQFRKLLRASDDTAGLLAHGRDYVAILIDQANERGAVDVLRDCQALDPSFSPETALHATELAHMAAHLGQAQVALQLLSGFQERFPRSQYIVTCGLLAADLLHEKLGRDVEARDVLLKLKATAAATDPLMPDIDAKLAVIERMIAATAKKPVAQPPGSAPA